MAMFKKEDQPTPAAVVWEKPQPPPAAAAKPSPAPAAGAQGEREIGRVQMDKSSQVVVRLTEWRGKQGLDIRVYMQSDMYTGYTKQGIRIPLDKIDDLRTLLIKAKNEIGQKPAL